MTYLIRVSVPDRPGSLGAVATAIGAAGGDILGVDVVERRADTAVDDLLVELPSGRLPDALVSACHTVEGARVEFVGRSSLGSGLHRDLEAVEAMTESPAAALPTLVELMPQVFRSGWALAVRHEPRPDAAALLHVVSASSGAPQVSGFPAPWLPVSRPTQVEPDGAWAPDSWLDAVVVAVPLARPRPTPQGPVDTIVLGRDGGPQILRSELARLTHLVGLLETITAEARGSGAGSGASSPGTG